MAALSWSCTWTSLLLLATGIGALYPRDSLTRETKSLDGVWQFRTSNVTDMDAGFRDKWYGRPLIKSGWAIPMPVPASYNDITQERSIRDYVGWAWYQRYFVAPLSWMTGSRRIVLRFGSVHYYAQVYLNGKNIVNHTGGHLPFEVDVTSLLDFTEENCLTVAVNNTLTKQTIPQGSVTFMKDLNRFPENFYEYSLNFDFFNYAGIHRPVVLYTTPSSFVSDVLITTATSDDHQTSAVSYTVDYEETGTPVECKVSVLDADSAVVGQQMGCQGSISVSNPQLWWPKTMSSTPGYLYNLQIELLTSDQLVVDVYSQPFGIRTVRVEGNSFLINGKPFYFMGFSKHEDSNIRGKGLDFPLIIKDFNLINWIGANCFRTSHYPYAEEIMDQADAQGIVVIDESPAVGLDAFDSILLESHKRVMAELVSRDRNRPSVVMWSVANEPQSSKPEAEAYFREVVNFTRTLDPTRPVSAALNANAQTDRAGQFMDVIMMNRYFGWYSDAGYTEVIRKQVINDFTLIYQVYKKPVIISEYGADTVAGLHMSPSFIFTEDYQTEFMMQYHQAFDYLRSQGFFIGELIWNFADFMTPQQITRVVGNKKGIFTRERQPKASAKLLRCRYLSLANATFPDDDLYCPAPKSTPSCI